MPNLVQILCAALFIVALQAGSGCLGPADGGAATQEAASSGNAPSSGVFAVRVVGHVTPFEVHERIGVHECLIDTGELCERAAEWRLDTRDVWSTNDHALFWRAWANLTADANGVPPTMRIDVLLRSCDAQRCSDRLVKRVEGQGAVSLEYQDIYLRPHEKTLILRVSGKSLAPTPGPVGIDFVGGLQDFVPAGDAPVRIGP